MLEERRANPAAQRVRAVNQLHALLRDLIPGGAVFGDNPERIRSEAAFAKHVRRLSHPCLVRTSRHRPYRGGYRQANAALYPLAITRMRHHQPTIDYMARRTTEGLAKRTSSAAPNGSWPARSN